MHACGHDVHTASLLGTARILWEMRKMLHGSFRLIFQPGEEEAPEVSMMISRRCAGTAAPSPDYWTACASSASSRKIGMRAGLYMASSDELYLTVTGRGGHGALPHLTADPILLPHRLSPRYNKL
ncbi:MAG: M20/M25/M40 family metallo-hydrolase [Saprospiraceae bacterium]